VKKIRIYSEGFGSDTVVVDEDGAQLENVIEATIYMTAREPNRISLEFIATPVSVAGQVNEVTLRCPCCEEAFNHECGGNTLGGPTRCSAIHTTPNGDMRCVLYPHYGGTHSDGAGDTWA
jgi:hypothetical protein